MKVGLQYPHDPAKQMRHLIAGIQGGWNREHDAEGGHTHITGKSLTLTESIAAPFARDDFGAKTRDLVERVSEMVSATDFLSVDPTGRSDSTRGLQRALDYCGATPGRGLRIPRGVYKVSDSLVFPQGVVITGESWGAHPDSYLILADSATVDAMFVSDRWANDSSSTGTPVIIRDLVLKGNKDNSATGRGIILLNWKSHLINLHILEFSSDGIYLPSVTSDGSTTIGSTSVEDGIWRCKIGDCGGRGIYSDDTGSKVTDGWIVDTVIHGTTGDGIKLTRSSGWRISGCHLYSIGGHGMDIQFMWATTVCDNYVEGFGLEGTSGSTYYGINTHSIGSRGSTVALNRVYNSQNASGVTYVNMRFLPGSDTAAEIVFKGNLVRGNSSDTGYNAGASSGGTMAGLMEGNYASNCGTDFSAPGTSHIANLRAEGNSWQYGSSAPASGVWIAGWKRWSTAPASSGNVGWVCTSSGTPGTHTQFGRVFGDLSDRAVERGFYQSTTVAASQSNVVLTDPLTANRGRYMVRAGSITALAIRVTTARTNGTCSAQVQKSSDDGGSWSSLVGCQVVITGADKTVHLLFDPGTHTFASGDLLRIVTTTSSDWAPTANDLDAWMEVAF